MPSLADAESAQRFHQMLMLHVARLKHRGDPVGLHQFLLGQALSLHVPAREGAGRCADCGQHFPCRTTLLTAADAAAGVMEANVAGPRSEYGEFVAEPERRS